MTDEMEICADVRLDAFSLALRTSFLSFPLRVPGSLRSLSF